MTVPDEPKAVSVPASTDDLATEARNALRSFVASIAYTVVVLMVAVYVVFHLLFNQ